MLSTQLIAVRVAELLDQDRFEPARRELFAANAVSIEAGACGPFEKETRDCRQACGRDENLYSADGLSAVGYFKDAVGLARCR